MPKYGFVVLIFNTKDMCLLDIICYVAKMHDKIDDSQPERISSMQISLIHSA